MSITIEEVKKLANLSRISLSQEEEERYAKTISAVLAYMTILNEVDTSTVEPTCQVTGLHDIAREDSVVPNDVRAGLLHTMPLMSADQLSVPAVFE